MMYPEACLTVNILILLPSFVTLTSLELQLPCPPECICLSQTQVLCNSGGLREIPVSLLPVTVEQLSLTKNHFPTIRTDSFAGLKQLRKLSLDGNNISFIKPFAFRGLPKLRELSIQHTPLTTVPRFAFAGLQNITSIILSHNRIERVESYGFAGTTNLKVLTLTNNPIMKLESNAFSGLISIDRLLLPSGIRTIEPDAFNGLDTVNYLKLSFMDLPGLEERTFRGLTNIGVFSIQESDLGTIESEAFSSVTNVNVLSMLNNKIDSIQGMNITPEHNINTLKIQGNHILEIPKSETLNIAVHRLVIKSNHFPCDCHIYNLLEGPLVNGSITEFISENFCISPLHMNGRPISHLDFRATTRCQEDVTRESLEDLRDSSNLSNNKLMKVSYWLPVICFIFRLY